MAKVQILAVATKVLLVWVVLNNKIMTIISNSNKTNSSNSNSLLEQEVVSMAFNQ
jgi:hypothetical protein